MNIIAIAAKTERIQNLNELASVHVNPLPSYQEEFFSVKHSPKSPFFMGHTSLPDIAVWHPVEPARSTDELTQLLLRCACWDRTGVVAVIKKGQNENGP